MAFGEILDVFKYILAFLGFIAAFRYLDGRARARKKFRKPKYKQYKLD